VASDTNTFATGPIFQIGGEIINPYEFDTSVPVQADVEAADAVRPILTV
jgi:hypothetical protein